MPLEAPSVPALGWPAVRKAIAAVVKVAAPNARVHDNWKLFFDLGKTTSLIVQTADGPSKGKIHSYMVQVNEARVPRGPSGEVPFVGGGRWDWKLTIDLWGFYDYELSAKTGESSQDLFEKELEWIAAYFFANQDLGLGDASGLRSVFPLEYAPIELGGFADGRNAHVAQGRLQVQLARQL